jgi:hypothetical protein
MAIDVIVPESQHGKATPSQLSVSGHISRVVGMLPTINLDNDVTVKTDKVHDEARNRHLSSELESRQAAIPQLAPQLPLSISRASAHGSRERVMKRWIADTHARPLTLCA